MADDPNPLSRGPFGEPLTESRTEPTPGPAHAVPTPAAAYGYPPPGYPAAGSYTSGAYAQGYPPPPKSRSGWFWVTILGGIFALVVLTVCLTFYGIAKALKGDTDTAADAGSNSIAVVDLDGVITDADKINKQLRKYGDDDNVKAIILHIDSPGGGAAASQEIFHEVVRIRAEKHKKIIASVESVGASGAYYIASGCDRIYANPASVVGSIGVIMEWTNYGELMRWAKLKNITIHAGELKDAGDPTRDLTPKEEAYFQSLVDNMYTQFVHDVATGRHTTDDVIKPLATGQVWTGEQALALHLIDQQGGFRIALMDAAKEAGITGEPSIVRPSKEKHGLLATLNDDSDTLFPNPSKLLDHAPGFYFMWK